MNVKRDGLIALLIIAVGLVVVNSLGSNTGAAPRPSNGPKQGVFVSVGAGLQAMCNDQGILTFIDQSEENPSNVKAYQLFANNVADEWQTTQDWTQSVEQVPLKEFKIQLAPGVYELWASAVDTKNMWGPELEPKYRPEVLCGNAAVPTIVVATPKANTGTPAPIPTSIPTQTPEPIQPIVSISIISQTVGSGYELVAPGTKYALPMDAEAYPTNAKAQYDDAWMQLHRSLGAQGWKPRDGISSIMNIYGMRPDKPWLLKLWRDDQFFHTEWFIGKTTPEGNADAKGSTEITGTNAVKIKFLNGEESVIFFPSAGYTQDWLVPKQLK